MPSGQTAGKKLIFEIKAELTCIANSFHEVPCCAGRALARASNTSVERIDTMTIFSARLAILCYSGTLDAVQLLTDRAGLKLGFNFIIPKI